MQNGDARGSRVADQLATVPCPLCGNQDTFLDVDVSYPDSHIAKYGDIYSGRSRSEWKICGVCGFVHQNPRPTTQALQRFYLNAEYRAARPVPERRGYERFARWYYTAKARFAAEHTGLSGGAVFDAGCGFGGALAVFREMGWRTFGVEADSHCTTYAREVLGLAGVVQGIVTPDVEPAGAIDLVFSNHAFEHFADLDQVMQGLVHLLRPGAFVFTCVPTYQRNRSTLSKRWMNSGHYSLFTHRSLNHLFARYGLEEVTHTYRGWWKEIDEIWHLAKYTGQPGNPREHYEAPEGVDGYLRWTNPGRSLMFAPIFDRYSERRQLLEKSALSVARLLGLRGRKRPPKDDDQSPPSSD